MTTHEMPESAPALPVAQVQRWLAPVTRFVREVMGLPLFETAELLANAGIKILMNGPIAKEHLNE